MQQTVLQSRRAVVVEAAENEVDLGLTERYNRNAALLLYRRQNEQAVVYDFSVPMAGLWRADVLESGERAFILQCMSECKHSIAHGVWALGNEKRSLRRWAAPRYER